MLGNEERWRWKREREIRWDGRGHLRKVWEGDTNVSKAARCNG